MEKPEKQEMTVFPFFSVFPDIFQTMCLLTFWHLVWKMFGKTGKTGNDCFSSFSSYFPDYVLTDLLAPSLENVWKNWKTDFGRQFDFMLYFWISREQVNGIDALR